MLTVQLKLHAPGAKTFLQVYRQFWRDPNLAVTNGSLLLIKTFLQVIRARFGRTTHITFCVFALLTNVIVTAMLMLGNSLNSICHLLNTCTYSAWTIADFATSLLVLHFKVLSSMCTSDVTPFNDCSIRHFPQFGSYLRKNWLDLIETFTTDVSLNN